MRKIYLFFLLCLTLFSTKGLAADFYWTGKGSSSNYNVVQNWALGSISGGVPTVVPGASDNVFFTDGAIKFDVNFNQANIVFNNFTASSTSVSKKYNFKLTAASNASKLLTINGIMNLSEFAGFSSNQVSGNSDYIGSLILNNSPIINKNVFSVFLVFNKAGATIKIDSDFEAMSIIVDNGALLDVSNHNVKINKNENSDILAGILKLMNSASGLNLSSTVLDVEHIWIKDFDIAKTNFTNSKINIHGGSHGGILNSHQVIPFISLPPGIYGLIVEKSNVTFPNVTIDNANVVDNRKSSIIANNLSITTLTLKETSVFLDTSNLQVNTLNIDRGFEYIIYGTSTLTTPSASPNISTINLNFNAQSKGVTRLTSNNSDKNRLSYVDFPIVAAYQNIVANNIYSKNILTFGNSILENLTKNINVNQLTSVNYYWGGKGDGKTWTDIGNWSLNGTQQIGVTVLPGPIDNVYFNANSIFTGVLKIIDVVDIHDFIVTPDFIGHNFEIKSFSSNAFTIRGSMTLQTGAKLNIFNLRFAPTSTDINNPESITQNGGIIVDDDTVIGYSLKITGGGAISLKGPSFTYFTPIQEKKFILENGSLIFDTPTVKLNSFSGVLSENTSFTTAVYLRNTSVNTGNWIYQNNNAVDNGGFTLDAGTSTISVTQKFTASDGINQYVSNKLLYNNVIVVNSNSSVEQRIDGLFAIKYLEINASVAFFTNNGAFFTANPTFYNDVNTLKLIGGNRYRFQTNNNAGVYRLNLIDKLSTVNGACSLVTLLEGASTNIKVKVAGTLKDDSNTANLLNLNSYDVQNITFEKQANYTINIVGDANAGTTGYTNLSFVTPKNLYWIGSTPTTNQWSNSVNWTSNLDGSLGGTTCAPTKFDNAHFKAYSNSKGMEVSLANDIYINSIIFENDSPTGMIFRAIGSKEIYLRGSLFLNKTTLVGINKINAQGIVARPTYDGTVRHKIQLRGGDLNTRINFEDNSYYKLVDNFISTDKTNYMMSGADIEANNIFIKAGDFSSLANGVGKLNIDNSSLELLNFNINSGIFTVNAANTIFKLANSNSPYFTYLGPTTTSGVNSTFSTATLEFVDKIGTNVITGPSNGALVFKSITTRGVTFNVNSDVTTNVLNSLSNKISIVANKELKVTQQANISGTSCDVTRSIVSTTPGTRAKFTILGGATNFDYLTVKDIDANSSYRVLVFGTYSTNGGNNTSYVQFLDKTTDDSTYGFGAVYACRDIAVDKILSASGFYPNAVTTYQWFKLTGTNADLVTPIATTRDIDLSLYGYGEYKLVINYDPSTAGACIINDQINITPLPTKPTELLDDKFCKNKVAIFDDIKIPGYKLVWYDSATSTTPILGTTPIVNGTTYYVARKTDSGNGQDCESIEREKLVLNLDSCGGVYINPALRMRSF